MTHAEMTREMRHTHLMAVPGALYDVLIWTSAGLIANAVSPKAGFVALFLLGVTIYPVQLLVNWMLKRHPVSPQNNLGPLFMQSSFIIPASVPLLWAASALGPEWTFAGYLIIVGVHYFPFVYAYGHWVFWPMGLLQVLLGMWVSQHPEWAPGTGAFLGAATFVVYAVVASLIYRREFGAARR